MDNINIESRKKDVKKIITVALAVAMAVVVLFVLASFIGYNKYAKGRDLAIETMMKVTSRFDDYEDNKIKLTEEIYHYLTRKSYTGSGFAQTARDVDEALGEILRDNGYHCWYGSMYLQHSNYFSYIFGEFFIVYTLVMLSIILIVAVFIAYRLTDKKMSLSIKNDMIICQNAVGKTKQLLLNDVKSVESAPFSGLKIKSTGVNYTICYLENANEIRDYLVKRMSNIATAERPKEKYDDISSEIEGLEKYKNLLDQGIITQEEFDAKKKQLLGL